MPWIPSVGSSEQGQHLKVWVSMGSLKGLTMESSSVIKKMSIYSATAQSLQSLFVINFWNFVKAS